MITEPLPRETELNDITLYEIKGDKIPVGIMDELMPFSNHEFKLYAEDTIYLFSDGYVDQFGGKKNKKFRSGNLKTTLLELESKKFDDRSQILQDTFEEWKGNEEQVDDVCILGFQINTLGNKNLG